MSAITITGRPTFKDKRIGGARFALLSALLWSVILLLNKLSQPYHLSLILFHLTPLNVGLACIALLVAGHMGRRKLKKIGLSCLAIATANTALYGLASLLTDSAFSLGAFFYLIPKIADLLFLYTIFSCVLSHCKKSQLVFGAFLAQLVFLSLELVFRAPDLSDAVLLRDGDKSLVSGGFSEIHVMAIFWVAVALVHPRLLLPVWLLAIGTLSRTATAAGALQLLVTKPKIKILVVIIPILLAVLVADTRLVSVLEKNPGNSMDFCYFKTGTGAGFRLDKVVFQLERAVNHAFRYEPVRQYEETALNGCERLKNLLIAGVVMVMLPGFLPVASALGWLPGLIVAAYLLRRARQRRMWIETVLVTSMLTTVGPFFFWWLPISPYEGSYYGVSFAKIHERGVTTYSDISWAWIALIARLSSVRKV